MPSGFLSSEQVAVYGRYAAKRPSREVLDGFFFSDDADRELAAKHRGDHNRLGFSVQLVTVRHVGRFLRFGDGRAGPSPGGGAGGGPGPAAVAAGPVAPRVRTPSGRGMVAALARVAQIAGLGMRGVDLSAVPTRRVIELARYGLAAKAPKLARHPYPRGIATLLATVRRLEVTAPDDALELFDTLMANELIGRAAKTTDRETVHRHAGQAKDTELLTKAVAVLLEAEEWGEDVPLDLVWAAIEKAVGPRERLRAALAQVQDAAPPPGADSQGAWRAGIVERYAAVRGFVKMLCRVIEFGATSDARPVLAAIQALPELLEARRSKKVSAGWLDARRTGLDIIPGGWWQRLVFPPGQPGGCVDRNAYVFCVLEAHCLSAVQTVDLGAGAACVLHSDGGGDGTIRPSRRPEPYPYRPERG